MEATCKLEKCPKGSKVPLRDHLEQVYKQTGHKPKQLRELPDIPAELAYVLNWYFDVKGSDPLTYIELKSWSDLTNTHLLPSEVEVIMQLDRIYWRVRTSD
ncbi:hypothetical protein [Vibrio phage vB_VhaS-tm]|nr:hypothetical protein [Vibrio phage vB_VhaS-tm]